MLDGSVSLIAFGSSSLSPFTLAVMVALLVVSCSVLGAASCAVGGSANTIPVLGFQVCTVGAVSSVLVVGSQRIRASSSSRLSVRGMLVETEYFFRGGVRPVELYSSGVSDSICSRSRMSGLHISSVGSRSARVSSKPAVDLPTSAPSVSTWAEEDTNVPSMLV
jgi:hypothetical protein